MGIIARSCVLALIAPPSAGAEMPPVVLSPPLTSNLGTISTKKERGPPWIHAHQVVSRLPPRRSGLAAAESTKSKESRTKKSHGAARVRNSIVGREGKLLVARVALHREVKRAQGGQVTRVRDRARTRQNERGGVLLNDGDAVEMEREASESERPHIRATDRQRSEVEAEEFSKRTIEASKRTGGSGVDDGGAETREVIENDPSGITEPRSTADVGRHEAAETQGTVDRVESLHRGERPGSEQ